VPEELERPLIGTARAVVTAAIGGLGRASALVAGFGRSEKEKPRDHHTLGHRGPPAVWQACGPACGSFSEKGSGRDLAGLSGLVGPVARGGTSRAWVGMVTTAREMEAWRPETRSGEPLTCFGAAGGDR